MANYLHVYAQVGFHEEAYILGNGEALKALRDAINRAIANGSSAIHAFGGDGEGYTAIVINSESLDDSEVSPFHAAAAPYTADYAKENRPGALWPHQLLKPGEREALEMEAWNR